MKIRDRIKEFKRVKGSDLIPNPRNWRTHPEAQANAMRGMLSEIGYADALLVRETPKGLMLIDGHLRAEISPDTEVPVLVLDLDQMEADKLLTLFDPLAAMADTDADALKSLAAGVESDNEALAAMLKSAQEDGNFDFADDEAPGEAEQDEVPEPPSDPITKLGDMILLGDHRLVCGDATDPTDVGKSLEGRKPFIMVTDPPYGVEYDPGWRNEAAKQGHINYAARREGKVGNDDRNDWTDAYKLFKGHVAYVWHAGKFAADLVVNLRDSDFEIRTQIIWKKPAFAISRGHYHWQHEPCWYAVRPGGSAKWCGDRSQSTVWDISNRLEADDKTDHGTQKPVECMSRPIRNHGEKDDDVYDPFLGSGTTIIAAQQLGRKCYGLELDPGYCDVIIQRWENLTGEKARRV